MNKMMKKCQTWLMAATLAFMSILTANAATVATLFKDATAVGEYETVEGAVAAYNDATAGGLYLIEVNAGEYVFSNCVITQSLTKALTIRPTKNDETFADVTLKSGSGAGFLLGVCGISHYDTMPTVIDHFTLDLSAKPKYGVKLLSGGGNRYVSHLTVSYCSFVGETTKAVYGLGAESGSQPSGITIDHCDAQNLGWFWTGYIADALPEALKFTNCTVSDCKYFVGIDDGKGDVVVDNCNVTVYGGGSYAYAIRLTAGSSGVDSKAVITRSSFTVGGASGDEYCVFVGYPKEANTTKSFYVDDYTATHLFNYAGQRFADVLDRNESTTDKSAKVVVYRNGNLVHTLTSCNTEYPSNRERFFFKTVAQVVSADGVTTNGFDTLAAALAAVKSGETVEILKGGEYPVATLGGSGYTIDATTADGAVTFTRSGDGWISGCANVTVKGLKWQVTPAAYQYIQGIHAVDCTFVGLLCTLTANTFAGCTFKPAGDNQYCVNSYASDDVFTNCTFETNGKAVYCYGDGASNGGAAWKIAFADCKFQSTQRRKVAIFVKTLKNTPYDVRIDSCQLLDSNWPKDNTERASDEQYPMGANGLWGLEGADTGLVTITLDGQQVYPELNYAAKIGTKGYATLAAAIAAVKSGETIVLLAANAEVITMTKTVPFAIDANGQELSGEITPAHGYGFRIGEGTCSYMKYWNEAKIVGGSEYATLTDAIAAAQDGDVIQMLCDTTANVTFPTGKELTLDLNGMTVEGDAQDAPILTVVAGAALTLKDSFGEGTLTGGKASCGGGVANYGTFNLKSGIIENCEAVFTTGNGGGVANYGLFKMTGGTIRNCVAGNLGGGVYSKTTTQDTGFFMTGGLITGCTAKNGFGIASDGGEANISGTSRIVMEFKQGFNTGYGVFANGGSLKIDGGEITVKQGTASAATPSGSGAVRVTGGGSATITGGSVKANIGDAVHIDTTDSKSEISGDAKVCGSISVDVKTTGEITINGTKFNGTDEPEVAPGYVAKKDATTGTWVVERDVVKPAEKAADEVETTVKDANGQAVTPSDALKEAMTNTVQEISDDLSSQAVGDIPNSDIIGEVKSASVRTPVVTALTAKAPQSVASEITDATRVSSFMAIELQATDMQAASAEATAVAVKSVTFEVKPVAEVTLIKDGETNRVSTVIDNEWIAGSPITFRLPVKVAGGVVRIVHTKEAVLIEEFLADVQEEDGVRFVQISSDRFSEFTEYEANADVIVAQVGDKYYDSLAEALEKAAANSTVKLIKDATLAGDVALSKALTIDADGKTITGGAITAADGYGVIATANGWTVEALSYVAQVGGTKYTTLAAALKAAQSGDTIEVLDGTWGADAVGTLTTAEAGVVRFKSLTIQPAAGATVTFTAQVSLGYDDSSTADASMTVKNIAFDGASLAISNYNQVWVEGCTFKNTTNKAGTLIVQDACCKNHKTAGGYPASQITIKDCVIDGSNTEASGIRLRNSGNVSITGCTIVNSQFNGILLESNGSVDNTFAKTVVVTGNEITEWNATNVKGGGRAIRAALGTLAEGSTVTIEGNTFRKETIGLDSPDFAKITEPGTATVSLNKNDWNDELSSVVSGNTAYYTVAGSAPAVADVVTTKSEQVVVDKPTTIDVTVNDAEKKDVPVSDPAVTNTVAELEGNRTMLAVDTGMDAINEGRGEPLIRSVVVKLTAIKVESTTPSVTNCTSATFDVKPVDKDGAKVVLVAGEAITFRLPIVAAFTASKVEVFHKADEASDFTSIGYYDVETYAGEKFAEVTSSAFSYFKYEIPDDAVIGGCKDSFDTEKQVTIPGEWIATANISRDVATNKTALCANGQPAWVNYVLGATDVTADVAALGISVTNGEATVEFCQIDEVPSVATVKFQLMVSDTVNGTYELFGEQGEKTFVDDQSGEGGKPQRFYKGVITFTWVE